MVVRTARRRVEPKPRNPAHASDSSGNRRGGVLCCTRARSCFAARAQAARVGHRRVAGARCGAVSLCAAQRARVRHRAGHIRRQLRAGARGAAGFAREGGAQPGAAVERSKRRRRAHQPRVGARLGARHALRAPRTQCHVSTRMQRRSSRAGGRGPGRASSAAIATTPSGSASSGGGAVAPGKAASPKQWCEWLTYSFSCTCGGHARRQRAGQVRRGLASAYVAQAPALRARPAAWRRAPCSSGWCGTCRGSSQRRPARW